MTLSPVPGEPDPDGADCVACGRCCHHGPHTVSVSEEDETRLGEADVRRLVVALDRPPFFHFIVNDGVRCGALDTRVAGHFPCSVYERRPGGCRLVEPGSPCCMEARRLGHLGTSVAFLRSDRTDL